MEQAAHSKISQPSAPSQFALLGQRRFAPFFWTQFLGAANDNVFKYGFTLLVTFHALQWSGLGGDEHKAGSTAAFLIGAIFIAPFVLFSATSGQIADKYDKARIMQLVKSLEIGIMLLAAWGFIGKQPIILYLCVFLMGLHSTLFGPVKYAFLPQHLREHELTGGNGLVEMGTFVAILLGTIASGLMVGDSGNAPLAAYACLGLAIAGRVVAAFIPASPSSDPQLKINWNPFTETWRNLGVARQNRSVFLSLLGISWLWFVGAIFLTSFAPFTKDVIGGSTKVVTVLLAIFSIGIALGSLLCERLSGHKVEIGLVPFGSIGMTVFGLDLYWASSHLTPTGHPLGVGEFLSSLAHWRILIDLFLLALFAGFYSVPLYALIQSRCQPSHRARMIGANNIVNALFMIMASLFASTLLSKGFTIPQLFAATAVLNAIIAIYIYTLVPEFLMRFLTWIALHTLYRVKAVGMENIPDEGPALVVCNHVSFADAVILGGMVRRPMRFVMDHQIFKVPVLSFIFRTAKAIPIAPRQEDPAMLQAAFDAVAKALSDRDVVCIFPEGKITHNGEMNPFRKGVEEIIKRNPVPVVPVGLQGMWGSFFSRVDGAAMKAPFRRGFLNKVGIQVGAPVLPDQVTAERLQAEVLRLRGDWR